jgi:glutamate-1-semialdehyde aminotransferase
MKTDRIPISSVFSKDAQFFSKDFTPQYLVSGRGSKVKDATGKEFIDWIGGLGASFLGYAHVGFTNSLRVALYNGTAFSLPHYLEYSVAEKLTDTLGKYVPGWQGVPLQVRWVKTGSDACNAALRLARAATGKKICKSQGYHGQSSSFVGMTAPHWGISEDANMHPFAFNDLTSLDHEDDTKYGVAAVILEQNIEEPHPDFYPGLRKWCDDHEALLIMDEVVTGVRYARGGACEVYGIQPDLVCCGKALGNGLPIAALVGPTEYMEWFSRNDPVFVSSTNAGDPISLAAADFILDYIHDGKYLKHLDLIGTTLMTGLREIGLDVPGIPCRSLVKFANNVEKGYFVTGMRNGGVLLNHPNFPNMAHTLDDVYKTVEVAKQVVQKMHTLTPEEVAYWTKQQPKQLCTNR